MEVTRRAWKTTHETERRSALSAHEQLIRIKELQIRNADNHYEKLRKKRDAGRGDVSDMDVKGAFDHRAQLISELTDLTKKSKVIDANWDRLKDASEKTFQDSFKVQARSKKNRLYLGNRQHVANYVAHDDNKKKRILDSNKWEWSLNEAWVEGGVSAGAMFKLKLDNSNPFASLPAGALAKIRQNPRMSKDQWLKICEQHPGTMLWVNGNGENRASWTALEIATLLKMGYHFDIRPRKNAPTEEQVVLVR